MAHGQRRDAALEARWRAVLARYRRSGLSVRAFCRREGLPESAFYAWRRTIRQRDGGGNAGDRTPTVASTVAPAFVPVMVQAKDAGRDAGAMVMELRGGRVLRLPLSMPPAQVAAIVRAIEHGEDAA